jgi:hypothetical protein
MSTGQIKIRRIKDTFFNVNELLYRKGGKSGIKFRLDHLLIPDIDNNLLSFVLRVQGHYDKYDVNKVVAEMQVQNIFEIENLRQYTSPDGKPFLPREVIINMVNISISHTRALLAKNLAGTLYDNAILPILSPEEVAETFFPGVLTDRHPPEEVAPGESK